MIIEKTFQGAIKISASKSGQLITKQYFGYSRKEAKQLFVQFLKSI